MGNFCRQFGIGVANDEDENQTQLLIGGGKVFNNTSELFYVLWIIWAHAADR